MEPREILEFQWPYLRRFLPPIDDIERAAVRTGALVRRREITSADRLLRLAMAYGFCGFSLRQTAAWAVVADIADVSDVALLKRFQKCGPWLNELVSGLLARKVEKPALEETLSMPIRLVDGTTISEPGSAGSDWRVHLGYDLRKHSIASIELTTTAVGESLRQIRPIAGELLIADRGYAKASGIEWVLDHGAHFLVRLPWNSIPLQTLKRKPFDLFAWLESVPEAAAAEVEVRIASRAHPLRLIAIRKSEPAAAATRKKIMQRATNHRKATNPRTFEAAGFVLVLTDLPAESLTRDAALDLYRFRWQIELCFKTLKSVINLADLPAKDPRLAQMILASKLLGALLVELFTESYVSISPWGYPLGEQTDLSLAFG